MRYWFGNSPADFVVTPGDQVGIGEEEIGYPAILAPGTVLWCWNPVDGGRVTDLLDSTGNPVGEIIATDYGRIPRFRGPDGGQLLLIGQAPPDDPGDDPPELHRWTIVTTSLPEIVAGVDARVAALEADSGGGGDVGSAIPLIFHQAGELESRVSAHPAANLEGRDWQVTAARASAHAFAPSGEVTVTVYTVDLDTEARTGLGAPMVLDIGTTSATVMSPGWVVPSGMGVTVGVEVVGDVEDLTVQVNVR